MLTFAAGDSIPLAAVARALAVEPVPVPLVAVASILLAALRIAVALPPAVVAVHMD